MSEECIVRHCAPTLAGIKTGNIFGFNFENREDMLSTLRSLNRRLKKKGLRIVPIRTRGNHTLVYVYRPSRLKDDLAHSTARKILEQHGYPCTHPQKSVCRLMKRLDEGEDFPHEIGLFLGYPPEDVHGFIKNKAQNFKLAGTWKVYNNEEAAKLIFSSYKECTARFCRLWKDGISIEQLTVAG